MKMMLQTVGVSGLLMLAACDNSQLTNQDVGAMTGGVVGAVLGSQFGKGDGKVAAAAAGAVVGGIVGGNIGSSLDELNRMKMANVLETTQTNHAHSWVDPDTNTKYTVKPTKTIKTDQRVCREYTMSIVVDGSLQTAKGTACRDASGNWAIVN